MRSDPLATPSPGDQARGRSAPTGRPRAFPAPTPRGQGARSPSHCPTARLQLASPRQPSVAARPTPTASFPARGNLGRFPGKPKHRAVMATVLSGGRPPPRTAEGSQCPRRGWEGGTRPGGPLEKRLLKIQAGGELDFQRFGDPRVIWSPRPPHPPVSRCNPQTGVAALRRAHWISVPRAGVGGLAGAPPSARSHAQGTPHPTASDTRAESGSRPGTAGGVEAPGPLPALLSRGGTSGVRQERGTRRSAAGFEHGAAGAAQMAGLRGAAGRGLGGEGDAAAALPRARARAPRPLAGGEPR